MSAADYATSYDPDTDFDRHYTIATARRIRERLGGGERVLELGCATGLMTAALVGVGVEIVALDRSTAYLERARARGLAGVRFAAADLDDLPDLGEPFDHVLATNVVHELADPEAFLRACGERVRPSGLVHVTLQNPHSLHRLCALELGLIDSLTEISPRGAQWGTRALWSTDELASLAAGAGLRVVDREGVMLKPLPNDLMAGLPEEVIEGFILAARHLPDHGAMNYLVLARA